MGRTGVGGHNMIIINNDIIMINMTRELYYAFAAFLYIILISPKGTTKLRWGGGGGGRIFFLRGNF